MSFIDRESLKALNIQEITDMIKPCSSLGKKLKSSVKPFTVGKEDELRTEYRKIGKLSSVIKSVKDFRVKLTTALGKIDNIHNSVSGLNNTKELDIQELFEIKHFLFYYIRIADSLQENGLEDLVKLESFGEFFRLLDPEGQNSPVFHVSNKYSEKLARLRAKYFETVNRVKNLTESSLEQAKQELNLSSIEKQVTVSRGNKKQIKIFSDSPWFALSSENFANITFVFRQTEPIIKLEKEISELKRKIENEELSIRRELTAKLSSIQGALLNALTEIAKLDYLAARAIFGVDNNSVIPTISSGSFPKDKSQLQLRVSAQKAVNIVVEKSLKEARLDYQPVDVDFGNRINIITGANMAGKSTILKTLGQFFYMCSHAIPLPCLQADLPLVDFIFFSSATEESHRTDLSSFAAELVAINNAVSKQGRGLFLIDEFARGTNPEEGEAFARAVMESFYDQESIVFSATHFTSLAEIKRAAHYRIVGISQEDYESMKSSLAPYGTTGNVNLRNRIEELHKFMDYSLEEIEPSLAPPQVALMIAEILGIDKELIEKAKSFLRKS
jgi:DNA mismatch repair protein MutS2